MGFFGNQTLDSPGVCLLPLEGRVCFAWGFCGWEFFFSLAVFEGGVYFYSKRALGFTRYYTAISFASL
jgi:hypothetical protein